MSCSQNHLHHAKARPGSKRGVGSGKRLQAVNERERQKPRSTCWKRKAVLQAMPRGDGEKGLRGNDRNADECGVADDELARIVD